MFWWRSYLLLSPKNRYTNLIIRKCDPFSSRVNLTILGPLVSSLGEEVKVLTTNLGSPLPGRDITNRKTPSCISSSTRHTDYDYGDPGCDTSRTWLTTSCRSTIRLESRRPWLSWISLTFDLDLDLNSKRWSVYDFLRSLDG